MGKKKNEIRIIKNNDLRRKIILLLAIILQIIQKIMNL